MPTAGQRAALEAARAVGERAAAWLRNLAVEKGERPEWVRGQTNPLLDLADAVRAALAGLDPADGDVRGPGGVWSEGAYGVPAEVRRGLHAGAAVLDGPFGGNRLGPARNAAILAVVACAVMAPDALPWGEYERDLPVLLDTIDHALTTP